MERSRRLRLSPEAAVLLRRAAALESPLHLVGGAVRDALLGRPIRDLDLVSGSARALAGRLARALGGTLVVLDEKNSVYRVALASRFKTVRHLDIAQRQGRSLAEDLARRDFTINAIALPLSPRLAQGPSPRELLDPRQGLADIRRGLLRAESLALFEEDPLRLLRAFRIAAELDFAIEPATLEMISRLRHRVRRPAGERVQAELLALLSLPGCSRWLKAMDEAGILTALFEDLEPARQCALVYYGPGGVLAHSLDTTARLDFLFQNLNGAFPTEAKKIKEYLTASAEGHASPRAILMLSALLHDVSKPETARQVGGRLRFFGHDAAGARRAEAILRKLKFSRGHLDTVHGVIANHLRPGNLAAAGSITDRAAYRFFRDLGDHALPLLLVCWADHASYLPGESIPKLLPAGRAPCNEAGGRRALLRVKPEGARKTVRHLQVVAHLVRRLFDERRQAVPERLIDGREVMKALGIPPGPEVGKWLERVREAQAEGKIRSPREALDYLQARASVPK